MAEKIKLTFVLPFSLQAELKKRLINDGYDLKGKSKWVAEAVAELLTLQRFPDLVKINDSMQGFERLESVVVSRELKKSIADAILTVRKEYPEIDGVQSRILRTAIVQRILR